MHACCLAGWTGILHVIDILYIDLYVPREMRIKSHFNCYAFKPFVLDCTR